MNGTGRPLDVVHVGLAVGPSIPSRFGGAIQRRILELGAAQAERGSRVRVYSTGPEGTSRARGVEIRGIRTRTPAPAVHLEFLLRVARDLARDPPSRRHVVHFHGQPEGAILGVRSGAPSLLSYDDFGFRVRGRPLGLVPLYRRLLGAFDVLLPCSAYCRDESAAAWGLDPAGMETFPNGVNTGQFRPDPAAGAAERRGLGVEGPIVLYVGRVCRQKGTDVLLEAGRLLADVAPRARLVVAGPVGRFDEGPSRGGDGGWARRIRSTGGLYLGAVPEERLAGLYNAADVFVMPTRSREMFGMAAVEAQACGRPVVASDHGGLRETVPEECGGRFPVGNAAALARGVARLLGRPELARACGEAALANARGYAWDRLARRSEELYRALWSAGARARAGPASPAR